MIKSIINQNDEFTGQVLACLGGRIDKMPVWNSGDFDLNPR